MATQRYISTSFWDDKWIRSLNPSDRYLYMYLLTNTLTNICGIYQITIDRIAYDTGYDERTLRPMLDKFKEAKKAALIDDEWMILPSWPKHQKWDIKATIKAGIDSALVNVPKHILNEARLLKYTYPIDSLLVGYQYSPSYSDLHSDIDTDSDIDTEASATPSPVFSKAEALNPNKKTGEQLFQQFKTEWNHNCKPKCDIIDTLHMARDEQNDWFAVKDRIDDPFKICKAMQNYGGILSSSEYDIDGHKGYSMLSFLVKGVQWYTDDAKPFERCKKKPAARKVERDLVPAEPNPFDAKNPFGGRK